jgi:hypothetical protein
MMSVKKVRMTDEPTLMTHSTAMVGLSHFSCVTASLQNQDTA